MRIQHNIMAMNAYRNYSNNVSAMKRNLEKLSSGYKINRAGDDAAGLAISEKMRAQITGLQQAQANAKSGINLVQTAEGALTEVHDMLNRMVKLADQSANGTFDDTTDRTQLQKEINQLLDEINRIADSANFNGIKLLDGSMNAEDVVTVNEPSFSNLQGMALTKVDGTDGAQLHEDSTGSAKTSFEVNLEGLAYKVTDADGKALANKDIGEQTFKLGGIKDDGTFGDEVGTIKYNVSSDAEGNITGADIAKAIAKVGKVTMTYDNGGADAVKIDYNVTLGEDGQTLKFEMSDAGYAAAVAASKDKTTLDTNVKNQNIFAGHYNFVAQNLTAADDTISVTENVTAPGYATMQDTSTSNVVNGSPSAGAIRGEAVLDFDAKSVQIKDGAGIKIGDQYYVWGGSDETVNAKYGDNVKVVDIRDLVKNEDNTLNAAVDATANSGTHTDRSEALSRLTVAAADNKMFNVQHNNLGSALVFTERETNDNSEPLKTLEGFKGELQTFDAIKANVDTKKATGKALTLQIGDTSESFNQLKVNIADCHADALGIGGIDISNQDSAAAAVDKIRAAINKVSDVRGTLGATQNRLDHTINNLSVMTENIQDAESTIRDVDVAEEMMAYTKNNILIQSAQAMLAQANQVPQGVLQLLQ